MQEICRLSGAATVLALAASTPAREGADEDAASAAADTRLATVDAGPVRRKPGRGRVVLPAVPLPLSVRGPLKRVRGPLGKVRSRKPRSVETVAAMKAKGGARRVDGYTIR